MSDTDYSQYGEQAYILETLGDMPPGRLLDIGAWHPTCFSNSRALIERGWGGILVEPSPGPVKALVQEYGLQSPQIRVIAAAVSCEPGFVELAVTDDAVSQPTNDPARIAEWTQTGGFFGNLTVPALTLKSLFHNFGGDFEFVNIDTEGTSVALLAEMLRLGPRPRCVCVEHDSRFVELSQYAEQGSYQLVHENGTNRIYRWTGTREW